MFHSFCNVFEVSLHHWWNLSCTSLDESNENSYSIWLRALWDLKFLAPSSCQRGKVKKLMNSELYLELLFLYHTFHLNWVLLSNDIPSHYHQYPKECIRSSMGTSNEKKANFMIKSFDLSLKRKELGLQIPSASIFLYCSYHDIFNVYFQLIHICFKSFQSINESDAEVWRWEMETPWWPSQSRKKIKTELFIVEKAFTEG